MTQFMETFLLALEKKESEVYVNFYLLAINLESLF